MTFFESLLKKVVAMLKVNAYFSLKVIIQDQLIQYSQKVPSLKDTINTLQSNDFSLLSICEPNDSECKKIQAADFPDANISNSDDLKPIKQVDQASTVSNIDDLKPIQQESDKCNFTASGANAKKLRNKEPNIVNTVVENGEEYVVVKSNWKFNPKKLTENQKEKLKKKRDIPALYQDLSQSQDEFKITAWKADSQDTSTTSSKSTSEYASTILKNMPSSEVVPKIMETILSDTTKETVQQTGEKISNDGSPKQVPAVKDPKTPRLALKDRVFRNVRNLMEKSGLRNENEMSIELSKIISDNNKTPNGPINQTNVSVTMVNSAPPKISAERPSRIIKKPKKLEQAEVYAIKKRCRQTHSHSDKLLSPALNEVKLKRIEINPEIEETEDNGTIPIPPSAASNEKERNTVVKPLVSDTIENAPLKDVQNVEINEQTADETCTNTKNVPEVGSTIPPDSQTKHRDDVKVDNSQKISTPKSTTKRKEGDQSSVKKKRSRIEKQLMIDMVEGHPLLQAPKEERSTRKKLSTPTTVIKRRSLAEKINSVASKCVAKPNGKKKEIVNSASTTKSLANFVTVVETQNKLSCSSDDLSTSEDIIESSQDSSITTISVKSAKTSAKKVPVVKLCKSKEIKSLLKSSETQRLLNNSDNHIISLSDTTSSQPENIICSPNKIPNVMLKTCDIQENLNNLNKDIMPLNDSVSSLHEPDDISLPNNKTMLEGKTELELTENMDTQPFEDKVSNGSEGRCSDVIVVSNGEIPIVIGYTEELSHLGLETQEIAEADTEPICLDSQIPNTAQGTVRNTEMEDEKLKRDKEEITMIKEDLRPTSPEAVKAPSTILVEPDNACSPLKHATQKKKDFLNDTIEISPIKTLSPVRGEKSPSPETSSDYVVIKLTSPVQSNGEPFNEKCDSPEIFTEEKKSPDKRDQSPPRIEVPATNASPSSTLSLNKNRPQMWSSGRAAQMLGLCAPDKLKAIMNSDRSVESEELKKSSSPMSTPARRNLRIVYNIVGDTDNQVNNDNQVNESEQAETANFLKFTRMLPSASSSPAGPILKRKLADIADEATVSPASKVSICSLFVMAVPLIL